MAITDKQAEIFLLLDDDMKRAIARPGRNVGRMLAQLVMHPRDRETQSRPPAVEPGNDDFEYSLESIPGYGEAKDWGLQLSDDLADWKAGRIPWSDVDTGLLLSGPSGIGKTIYAKALANTCDVELIPQDSTRIASFSAGTSVCRRLAGLTRRTRRGRKFPWVPRLTPYKRLAGR
ncbi:AAA family ATPase [Rhizobium ruizarguesonis]|uniref:AAA family ATPase n=1 Tax=Rhizobium ruizarguesonis TaxID=2081791 RepID=UPI001FDFF046|nr:AAA family ATPase [Rhizobium ruizarguesonis]